MPSKRDVLSHLTRDELLAVVDQFGLEVPDRRAKDGLVDAVAASKKATPAAFLPDLPRDRLKEVCTTLGLDDSEREKAGWSPRRMRGAAMRIAIQLAAVLSLIGVWTDAHANPELAARLQKSVVKISIFNGNKLISWGSGVIVERTKIVTNFHVVCEFEPIFCHSSIQAQAAGRDPQPARIVYVDIERDIAQLEVDEPLGPSVSLRRFDTLKAGERVFAVGWPRGTRGSEPLWTEGVISGPARLGPDEPLRDGPFLHLEKLIIQHSAPIGSGSSGGGLFDGGGRLIGLNTQSVSPEKTQNLATAVSADHIGSLSHAHKLTVEFIGSLPKAPKFIPGQDVIAQLIAVTEQEVQADPGAWPAWAFLAECYHRSLRFDDAIRAARRAVEINPQAGDGWYWLGSATFMNGNPDAACYSFDQAVQVAPAHVDALMALASCRYGERRVDDAARLLKVALGLDRENIAGWISLGMIYVDNESWENAEKCFGYARELYLRRGESPTPDLLKALAFVQLRRGNIDGPIELAMELDHLDPDGAEAVRDAVAKFRSARAARLAPRPTPAPPPAPRASRWQTWRENKHTAHAFATLGPIFCFALGPFGLIAAPTTCCLANVGVWIYYASNEPPMDE